MLFANAFRMVEVAAIGLARTQARGMIFALTDVSPGMDALSISWDRGSRPKVTRRVNAVDFAAAPCHPIPAADWMAGSV
jgi:hypothetical protein